MTKSWVDDNHFAFTWRPSGSSAWSTVVVWDRTLDKTYLFDIADPTNGVTGFQEAHLDKSGESLIVSGDQTLLWRFASQSQSQAVAVANDPASNPRFDLEMLPADQATIGVAMSLDSTEAPSNQFSNLRGNTSSDRQFFIFESGSQSSGAGIFIAQLAAQELAVESLQWTNMVNCAVVDNALVKTGGVDNSDDARADSLQSLSADGYIEFTALETDKERWCGLRSVSSQFLNSASIDYGFGFAPARVLKIFEKGTKRLKTRFRAGDVFRIAVENGSVKYYQNGSLLYISRTTPGDTMVASASFSDSNSTIGDAVGAGLGYIRLTPDTATIAANATQQFSATVLGNTGSLVWTATAGTIVANGATTAMYTAPGTPGTYQVTVASSTNPTNRGKATVIITPAGDTTAPVISSVQVNGVTSSGATITWLTNEASDTQIDYGTTSNYGSSTTLDSSMVTSHGQTLSGLVPNTLYFARLRSRDAAGNLATAGAYTFTTTVTGDTTAPVISSVGASGITSSGATVSWVTNEASNTQVDYGTTTSYGSSTTLNSSLVTSHSQALSGLAANTLYHYRVKSRDAAGNLATSGDFTFTTSASPDTTAPVISSVGASGITTSGATVSWTTNEASNTQVDYGTTTSYGSSTTLNSSLVTSHSQALSGLAASTLYHYRVKSRDAAGNLATSGDFTFTTSAAPDTTAPVISSVQVSGVTTSGATVSWVTNEASNTQVDYGTTTSYGSSTTLNSSLVTSHSQALSGLAANTLYHYRVKSRDAAGNLATSGDFTFTTSASPDTTAPVISSVGASGITTSGATVSWTTNEASNTQVDYGTTTSYGSSTTLNSSLVTSHSQALSGLAASTLYHYRVKSRDAAGNLATSGDFTFTTAAAAGPSGPTYWVSPSGSDTNPGTQSLPFKTIQRAAGIVNPGDTVIVMDGVYTMGTGSCTGSIVCLTRGGTASQPITFKSQNRWGAKLNGESNRASTGFNYNSATANYINIEGFEIYGIGANGSAQAISAWKGGQGSRIVGNHIHDIGRLCTDTSNGQSGITIKQANVVVDGNLIHDVGRFAPGESACVPIGENYMNHDHGIYLDSDETSQPTNVVIKNNVFYNVNRGWPIHLYSSDGGVYDGVKILHNTFATQNPYRDGHILLNGDIRNTRIENNISYQPKAAMIALTEVTSGNIARNNLTTAANLFGGSTGAPLSGWFSSVTGNRTGTDPRFINPASRDYHLQSASPAIDTGINLTEVPQDYDNRNRPQGAGLDMGAFEFSTGSSATLAKTFTESLKDNDWGSRLPSWQSWNQLQDQAPYLSWFRFRNRLSGTAI